MHVTAFNNCEAFANNYQIQDMTVLDVGSMDVNGSLRPIFEDRNCKYTGLDIGEGKNVDVSMKLGEKFPFEDNSFDVIVSSSCLEHDPAFWVTVGEMMRVSKRFIYLNVPSEQKYHAYPVDCWRFLNDSMAALADLSEEWELKESYIDNQPPWKDCVGIFEIKS